MSHANHRIVLDSSATRSTKGNELTLYLAVASIDNQLKNHSSESQSEHIPKKYWT